MKKIFFAIFAIAALVFNSCSNKVDLYADEGEYTIIYAMLDADSDTNFVKVTKSFLGNASELAYNYDANNYKYDEIDVTMTGKFNGSGSTQTITLDTISKWIPYDPNATFYTGCYQRYYYTAKDLAEGESYQIDVLRKSDGVVSSAKCTTINTYQYQKPNTAFLQFTDVVTSIATVEWRVTVPPFKSTASYFEVTGYFRYKELQPGAQDTTYHYIQWNLGEGTADNLYNTSTSSPYYVISYSPSNLYSLIGSDRYLKENSPVGVKRYFDKFEFKVTGIGDELYNYNLIANSTSAIQDMPNYTNVSNGYGIVSARVSKYKKVNIAELTRTKIISKYPEYGFISQ